jgi:hypothetical protein
MTKTFYRDVKLRRRTEKASEANGWKGKFEFVLARVEVEVDFDRIFEGMGQTALANKSRKAVEGSGLLVVRVKNERPF